LLRLPNALRCRLTAASGILKQLQYFIDNNANITNFAQRSKEEFFPKFKKIIVIAQK
jgi:hypothetical protein